MKYNDTYAQAIGQHAGYYFHLKPGHWFHALSKVCSDRDDVVHLNKNNVYKYYIRLQKFHVDWYYVSENINAQGIISCFLTQGNQFTKI